MVSESKLYVGDCEMLVETESKSKILDGIDKDLDVIAIDESSLANGLWIFGGSGSGNDKFIEGLVGVILIKHNKIIFPETMYWKIFRNFKTNHDTVV